MRCNVCGRQVQNEQANFCDYCGSSFREQKQNSFNIPPKEQGLPYGNGFNQTAAPMQPVVPVTGAPFMTGQEKPTSFLNWLGTYGLLFVPFVGWLIFLIMLIVWSFSNSTPVSKKNWARATLIFAVIVIAFVVILFLIFYLPIYQEMYQQMQNGTFDPNTFYNDLMKQYY